MKVHDLRHVAVVMTVLNLRPNVVPGVEEIDFAFPDEYAVRIGAIVDALEREIPLDISIMTVLKNRDWCDEQIALAASQWRLSCP